MDQYTKEFIDYLFYIGIITNETIPNFITSLKYNVDNEPIEHTTAVDNIKEILTKSIIGYFAGLTNTLHQSVAVNIVSKFAENKQRAKYDVLRKLIPIYDMKQLLKERHYLIKWNIKALTSLSNRNIKYDPQENQYTFTNDNNNSVSLDKINSCIKRTQSSKRSESKSHIDNFIQRQAYFDETKTKKKEKLLKHTEDECRVMCTFTPNISLSRSGNFSEGNRSAYLRLYEDSNKRKINYHKKIDAFVQQIKTDSNQNKPQRKNIDKQKIEHLYNDYKTRKMNQRALLQQIDYESGFTFKPQTNASPSYKKPINTTYNSKLSKYSNDKSDLVSSYTFHNNQRDYKQTEYINLKRKPKKH